MGSGWILERKEDMSSSTVLSNLISLVAGYAHDRHAINIEELDLLESLAETLEEIECYDHDDLVYLQKMEEVPEPEEPCYD
jgi:hypothetical protein